MLINSIQAGKLLGGVTASTVRGLIKAGRLYDKATTTPGKKRHVVQLDLAEVKALKATYRVRQHHHKAAAVAATVAVVAGAGRKPSTPVHLSGRLGRIEKDLAVVKTQLTSLLTVLQ